MMYDLATLLLVLLFGSPLVIFLFYGTILLFYSRPHPKNAREARSTDILSYEPTVSVVLPTHDEQDVITNRIENLLHLNYPKDKMEIIIVDDSVDSTPKIVEQYMKTNHQIRMIRFDCRMGYSPCLIAGCKAAEGEVVVLAEASSLMDEEAIRYLVSNFVNPNIGVVTGKARVLNPLEGAEKSEVFYLRLYDFARSAESNMDSTIYVRGEAAAIRRSLLVDLKDLENFPGTADTGLAIMARKKGFKAVCDPRVLFFEHAPAFHRERIHQKVTRGANLTKALWAFRSMFLKPEYGKFGMITLPVSFAMLAIVPLLLLVGFFVFVLVTLMNPATYYPIWIVAAFLVAFALVFWRPAVFTAFESEYSLLRALYDIVVLRKSHDKIDKVTSTRRWTSDR